MSSTAKREALKVASLTAAKQWIELAGHPEAEATTDLLEIMRAINENDRTATK